jgi:diguanylate cyclase (GGDEF)-like protein
MPDDRDRNEAPGALEQLLEASWATRLRPLDPAERRLEGGLTAAFLVVAGLLLLALPGSFEPSVMLVAGVFGYALASRVVYPLGAGYAVPTQLVLVVLFATEPAALVPVLVLLGMCLGTIADTLLGRSRLERLVFAGGDAAHVIAPAALLVATGHAFAGDAAWPLLCAALGAQLFSDLVFSTLREWVATGVRPEVQLRVIGQVWAVDLSLTPLGVLAVASRDETVWAPVALLPILALFAYTGRDRAALIGRAYQRLEEVERERGRLRVAVRRIGEAFASNLDLDALLQIVTSASVEALDADLGRASTSRGAGRRLLARATVQRDDALLPVLKRAEMEALAVGGTVGLELDGRHAMACPLVSGSQYIGVLAVARSEVFDAEERELLAYLCEQASISAGNVVRHESLHRMALTDELTGLANHRRFQELLAGAVGRCRATGEPLALVMMDIDDFKMVNDSYGHQTGDVVLAAVGRRLREECRAGDEPARYGGEEFAVVLEGADLRTAHGIADRLRREIAALPVAAPTGEPLGVTVSVGVSMLEGDVSTAADLIGAADAALYAVKGSDKNGVLVARGDQLLAPRFTPARPA